MKSYYGTVKLWLLALLFFCGISMIAVSFIGELPDSHGPSPSSYVTWGICCLLIAGFWMYWDRKRQQLTPDQQVEK